MYSSSMCSSKSYVTSPSTQNSSICTEHFCFVSPEKSHKFTLSMGVPRHQHIHNILHVGAPQQDAQFFFSGGGHSPFLSNSPGIHSTTLIRNVFHSSSGTRYLALELHEVHVLPLLCQLPDRKHSAVQFRNK